VYNVKYKYKQETQGGIKMAKIEMMALIVTADKDMYEVKSFDTETQTFQVVICNPVYGFARKNAKVTTLKYNKTFTFKEMKVEGYETVRNTDEAKNILRSLIKKHKNN
jgi:hypothetical protein